MACNKPKCGEKNPCKKCTQDIVVESCDKLCPFILESDCVTISRDIECGDVKEGDTLTEALEKVCGQGGGGDNCPCPVSTYTVNSVCSLTKGGVKEVSSLESTVDPSCAGTYEVFLDDISSNGTGAKIEVTIEPITGEITLTILENGINYVATETFEVVVGTCTINIVVDQISTIGGDINNPAFLIFNVTPNFSQSTPTYIDVASQIPSFTHPYIFSSSIKSLIPTITEGESFSFAIGLTLLQPQGDGDDKFYSFQLVDNLGNYSEVFTILDSEIQGCILE
jgi:hypothetical protein